MVLAELANGKVNQVLRAYHEGRELQADLALPYETAMPISGTGRTAASTGWPWTARWPPA